MKQAGSRHAPEYPQQRVLTAEVKGSIVKQKEYTGIERDFTKDYYHEYVITKTMALKGRAGICSDAAFLGCCRGCARG